MKFQYSLRTLIIATFIASIGVWIGVQLYLENVPSPDLEARRNVVWSLALNSIEAKFAEYRGKSNYYGLRPTASWSYGVNEWNMRQHCEVNLRPSNSPKNLVLFDLSVTCSRHGLDIRPIVIEYGDAIEKRSINSGNSKAICDEKHWKYEIRKVDEVKE